MIFRDFEQKIIKDINESGMSIDAVYFVMKSIMQEIEQRYYEYCRQEDAEAALRAQELENANEESSSEVKEPVAANNEGEGAN